MEIRNIAIIAHVDHGKTTITDNIMRQTGMFEAGMSMDVNKLEQERGITIYAKNTSLMYKGTKINIVDTPGHADFGSEVERILRSIDSVILVVDAQEGPMPQTRFVLKKSLELGHRPMVCINKIDKPAADPKKCVDEVFELFMELGANDEQLNFPIIYAIGREGVAMRKLDDPRKDLMPMLDMVLEHVPAAEADTSMPFRAQAFNLAYDNFLGRLAICRVYDGKVKSNAPVFVKKADGAIRNAKIVKLFTFEGIARKEIDEAVAGDIVMIAGIPDVFIGETITTNKEAIPLPAIVVDEPTITLNFSVNDSPFAGQDGKFLTGRQLRERLEKEIEVNVGLHVDFVDGATFKISGRGELHIAILLENMRREGYEMQVSQPQIIMKEENGVKLEPFEEVVIDVPKEFQGSVIERLSSKKGSLTQIDIRENTARLIFQIPTRGLLGYRGQFIIDTKGEGIMSSRVIGFKEYAGEIAKKATGAMISCETGKALAFSLWNLQERGTLYIDPATEVYEGMVIGDASKGEDMSVNPIKGKQLTNMRSSRNDESISVIPAKKLTIESGLEIMAADEYLEVTPKNVRLRKKWLTEVDRVRAKRGM